MKWREWGKEQEEKKQTKACGEGGTQSPFGSG